MGKWVGGRPPACLVLNDDKSRLRAQDLQLVCEMDKTTGLASSSFWMHAQKCSEKQLSETGAGLATRENCIVFTYIENTREGQGMTMPQ